MAVPLPALLLLFVGSGAAALVYETVWLQLLQLVIGSSAVSVGVLLGTFMGGMCLGSLWLPGAISARRHPLRVYALLELGVGSCGLVLLFAMPLVGRVYFAAGGGGAGGVLARGIVAAVCLLPPTILMGATLPAVSRWIETTPAGVSWLGYFYGGNIAGAVCGCLLAGFYLLRVYDTATATYTAAAINLAVGAIALALAALTRYAVQAIAPASRSWHTPSAAAASVTTNLQRNDAAALPAPRPRRKTARMIENVKTEPPKRRPSCRVQITSAASAQRPDKAITT